MPTTIEKHKVASEAEVSKLKEMAWVIGKESARIELHRLGTRTDLSGCRIKSPNDPAVFLIDPEGYRRWIPDQYTYNRLFTTWGGIIIDIDVVEIARGSDLSHGATLIRCEESSPVYFVSNGHKRWVTSPGVMGKYSFRWPSGGDLVAAAVVDAIPAGPNWT